MTFKKASVVILFVLQASIFKNGKDFGSFYKVKSTYEK